MNPPVLSLLETRVLGVLVEKQHTVPDTYPLTLNALTAGRLQPEDQSRPVAQRHRRRGAGVDRRVEDALVRRRDQRRKGDALRAQRRAGARHSLAGGRGIPSQAVALLATLMLRGPQTVAELRQNSERLHRFADASAVEGFLDELAAREGGPLAVELPRQPGARETRWMHLLSGPPPAADATADAAGADGLVAAGEIAALKANVAALQRQVAALEAGLARLKDELGIRDA